MPRNAKEENVKAMSCKGRILFLTIKDIKPGDELLYYYGDYYASRLGIHYKLGPQKGGMALTDSGIEKLAQEFRAKYKV